MGLQDHNDELFREFVRRTRGDTFKFPSWWADQVRTASRLIGRAAFASLSKVEQHQAVLDHVRLGEAPLAE